MGGTAGRPRVGFELETLSHPARRQPRARHVVGNALGDEEPQSHGCSGCHRVLARRADIFTGQLVASAAQPQRSDPHGIGQ